jgi:hypothetical protein
MHPRIAPIHLQPGNHVPAPEELPAKPEEVSIPETTDATLLKKPTEE